MKTVKSVEGGGNTAQPGVMTMNFEIWHQMFDGINDPVFLHDPQFRVLLANRAYCREAGVTEAEALGKPYWEVFPLGTGPMPSCKDATIAKNRPESLDEVSVGAKLFLSWGYTVHDEPGNVLYALHILSDITAQRQATATLRSLHIRHELDLALIENKEQLLQLVFQNEEKEKRAAELVIANKELAFQNEEKEKRATELAIANKELEDSLEDTVQAIATIGEMRDPYTAGHQARVAELAAAIGRHMGLPDEQVHAIHLAGVVHDLGKIKIPTEILSKPGRISEAEFVLIKAHPQAGYDILKGIRFPWPIAQMVLQHHERLDGSGYPQGLKGDAILLEARILSVADVVEAMFSYRPYRPGLGIEKALAEIVQHRGTHYDPQVVDACLALFHEQGYRFPERE